MQSRAVYRKQTPCDWFEYSPNELNWTVFFALPFLGSGSFLWILPSQCLSTDSKQYLTGWRLSHLSLKVLELINKCNLDVELYRDDDDDDDDVELYRNIPSASTIPCICCLYHRHNVFTRYHIYSLSQDKPELHYNKVLLVIESNSMEQTRMRLDTNSPPSSHNRTAQHLLEEGRTKSCSKEVG